jgi:WD repeat-containing protein 48
MAPPRRRISYIIPPPIEPVPRLQLPPFGISRLGCTGPLLLHSETQVGDSEAEPQVRHPRHRLGVASLALDSATQLQGHDSPGGILYTGGRDGLVISWDLGMPMKRRERKPDSDFDGHPRRRVGRWEIMTGWADDAIDEEAEEGEEKSVGDGDVIGSVTPWRSKHHLQDDESISYEQEWELDHEAFTPGKVSHFVCVTRPLPHQLQ